MAVELVIAPEAEQDLREAYFWYEDRRAGLGEEFISCVDVVFRRSVVCRKCMRLFTKITAIKMEDLKENCKDIEKIFFP